ncbi:MAG: cation diffusion facilitator family transporter [Alphaproteobacteria bacterium]|nr:cation diffusion facilitator family transporter [Alphaproteobacteria bacterium]
MHTHHHPPQQTSNLDSAFRWAVTSNAVYVVVEAAFGVYSGSLALLADAAHNLMDVGGLLLAWGAAIAAKRPPNGTYTYGYGRATILAALINALVIMIGVGGVVWEALKRFSQPTDISAELVIGVALLGIGINAGTALLFRAKRHDDLNAEGAFLHMMTDAAVSLAVVIGGGVVLMTGWAWVDPLVAIGVSLLVAVATYGLLKSSLHLTLDGVPGSVNHGAVQRWLCDQQGVAAVHDLHIWALSTTMTALTAHLIMPGGCSDSGFLQHLSEELNEHFNIQHTTFQVELSKTNCCAACCANHEIERKKAS